MIVLLCGPSGSGKTTLLSRIAAQTKAKVLDVTVCRSNPRGTVESGKQQLTQSEFAQIKARFQFLYRYDDTVYGYSLHPQEIASSGYAFLDYPGEYPACNELNQISWRGILVLPPSRDELVNRLKNQQKPHRIPSALQEYDEILEELNSGQYSAPAWRVFRSTDESSLNSFIDDVIRMRLFAQTTILAR